VWPIQKLESWLTTAQTEWSRGDSPGYCLQVCLVGNVNDGRIRYCHGGGGINNELESLMLAAVREAPVDPARVEPLYQGAVGVMVSLEQACLRRLDVVGVTRKFTSGSCQLSFLAERLQSCRYRMQFS
jgi:hypothetical protein